MARRRPVTALESAPCISAAHRPCAKSSKRWCRAGIGTPPLPCCLWKRSAGSAPTSRHASSSCSASPLSRASRRCFSAKVMALRHAPRRESGQLWSVGIRCLNRSPRRTSLSCAKLSSGGSPGRLEGRLCFATLSSLASVAGAAWVRRPKVRTTSSKAALSQSERTSCRVTMRNVSRTAAKLSFLPTVALRLFARSVSCSLTASPTPAWRKPPRRAAKPSRTASGAESEKSSRCSGPSTVSAALRNHRSAGRVASALSSAASQTSPLKSSWHQ